MKLNLAAPTAALVAFAVAGIFAGCTSESVSSGGGGAGGGSTTGAAPAPAPAPAFDPAKAATINGKVKFEGAAPATTEVDMSGTPECHAMHPTPQRVESLIVNNGMV